MELASSGLFSGSPIGLEGGFGIAFEATFGIEKLAVSLLGSRNFWIEKPRHLAQVVAFMELAAT